MPETDVNTDVTNTPEVNNAPSVDELMERIAQAEALAKEAEERAFQAEAKNKKYKNTIDKQSSEIAERKRMDRQNLPEAEAKAKDAEDRADKAEERAKELEAKIARIEGLSKYQSLSEDSKVVENFYEAVSENDHDFIMKFITNAINTAKEETRKEVTAEIQKNYPQTNVGANGSDGKSRAEKLVEKTRNNKPQNSNSILSHYI